MQILLINNLDTSIKGLEVWQGKISKTIKPHESFK